MPAAPAKRPRGHGSITLDGGRYIANYRDLESGRQRRRSFATEADAHVFLNEWFAAKARRASQTAADPAAGPAIRPLAQTAAASKTFEQAIVGWRASKLSTINSSTWRNYDPALERLRRYLGQELLDDLAPEHFETYRDLCLEGIDPTAASDELADVPPLSAATVNQHLDRARDVLKWALRRKHRSVPGNPLEDVEHAKRTSVYRPAVLTEQQIAALIAAASEKHRLTFALLGHLALRISEALAVGVDAWIIEQDGDEVLHRLSVQAQVKEERPSYKVAIDQVLKSHYAYRELVASPLVVAERERALERLEGRPNPRGLLTPARNGEPMRYRNWMRDVWGPTLRAAGLDSTGLTPHGLRHSRLSLMARSGRVTIGDLSKFAGHESVAFTLRKYGDHYSSPGVRPEAYLTA
jgi:integrase